MAGHDDHPEIDGKRVLVVNDTQEILELFDAILSAMGLEVVLMTPCFAR